MTFYPGLHHPADSRHFQRAFISINVLKGRKFHFSPNDWIMDSGAFSEISIYGQYRTSAAVYAQRINRWMHCGNMLAAFSQDWMCEPVVINGCPKECRRKGLKPCHPVLCAYGTRLDVPTHQRLTIERYDQLSELAQALVVPVLQGYAAEDYVNHIRMYGDRLTYGMWVGVGSVCKRNSNVGEVLKVLRAIKEERPDLKLHGLGLKKTALESKEVRDFLHSSDSMAWSYAARMARRAGDKSRSANDWREAKRYTERIEEICS